MPTTTPAASEPTSALALSQWPTQRCAPIRSSVDRAISGISAAPLGGIITVATSPTTTAMATTGAGADQAAANAAAPYASACTASPPTRTACGRQRAITPTTTGVHVRGISKMTIDVGPTATAPPRERVDEQSDGDRPLADSAAQMRGRDVADTNRARPSDHGSGDDTRARREYGTAMSAARTVTAMEFDQPAATSRRRLLRAPDSPPRRRPRG